MGKSHPCKDPRGEDAVKWFDGTPGHSVGPDTIEPEGPCWYVLRFWYSDPHADPVKFCPECGAALATPEA
jgi:hypothetical protein